MQFIDLQDAVYQHQEIRCLFSSTNPIGYEKVPIGEFVLEWALFCFFLFFSNLKFKPKEKAG
jgi:hypothetical protein